MGDGTANYELYSDNTAKLTGTSGVKGDVVIPSSITNEGVQYEVTVLGKTAFIYNSLLTGVTIPKTVLEIEDASWTETFGHANGTFAGCSKLSKITFENGSKITRIGNGAFAQCKSLTDVVIPEGVKTLGGAAFGTGPTNGVVMPGDYAYKSITLPSTLESLQWDSLPRIPIDIKVAEGSKHFSVDKGILYDGDKSDLIRVCNLKEDVTLPSTLKTVQKYAAYYAISNDSIEKHKLVFPEGFNEFSDYAFYKCPYDFNVPSTVKVFGERCFQFCTQLKELTIGEGATTGWQFLSKTSVTSLTCLADDVYIDSSPVVELVLSDKLTNIVSLNSNSALESVTYVGKDAVKGAIQLPPTLKTIGDRAFSSLPLIESITIPANVESVGGGAISGLAKLSVLRFEGSELPEMTSTSISGCALITESRTDGSSVVKFQYAPQPDGTWTDGAFVTSFKAPAEWDGNFVVSKDVVSISGQVFSNKGLKDISVEAGNPYYVANKGVLYTDDVKTIVVVSDAGKNVKVPASVEVIGPYAFATGLESPAPDFSLATNLKTIGEYAFNNMKVRTFTIPASVTLIDRFAFMGSEFNTVDLSKITSERVKIGQLAFASLTNLNEFILNDTTYYEFGSSALLGSSLKTFSLENGAVGEQMFLSSRNLGEVYLGPGVDSMGSMAFRFCDVLETVYLLSSNLNENIPVSGLDGFNGVLILPLDDQDWSDFEALHPVSYVALLDNGNRIDMPSIEGLDFSIVGSTKDSITVDFTLLHGYTDSKITVKLDGTEVVRGDKGYVLTPSKKSTSVVVEGVVPNTYNVTVEKSDLYTITELYPVKTYGGVYTFIVDPADGYETDGLKAIVGEDEFIAYHGGKISVDIFGDTVITIAGVVPEKYDLTFVKEDGSTVSSEATNGVVFDIAALEIGTVWYVMGSETPVDFSKPLTSDETFYTQYTPVTEDFAYLYFSTVAGDLTVTVDGEKVESGDLVPVGSTAYFTYDGGNNHRLTGYRMNGSVYDPIPNPSM